MSIDLHGRELSAQKVFTRGTHRARSPGETIAAYRPLLSRFGITRLANVTGLDTIGVPVYVAIRPNARSLATSQGKGLDADAAKASAMMEAIELWHAEHVVLPLRRESYPTLRREANVVDPARLPLMRGRTFAPERRHLWAEGFDISRRCATWVPLDLVSIDEIDPEPTFCQSSNGLSSGNHLLEAMVHGICEVIERDATVLWRLSDESRRLDLATVDEPYCLEVLRRIEAAGVYAAAWDITSDVGVPAYACVIIDSLEIPSWRRVGFHIGFGCHLTRDVALSRALTEAVQARLTFVTGSRDDLFRGNYAASKDERTWREVSEEMVGEAPSIGFGDRPSLGTDSFDDDVHVLREALARVGSESIIVCDLTREDVGIPVVKVIIPGLEGPEDYAAPGARAQRVLASHATEKSA